MPAPERKTEVRSGSQEQAVHDVGGLTFGPISLEEHDLALWERRVDAMLILLVGTKKNAFTVDSMRRVIESYGEQQYDATTYYEKWVRAIRNLLIEQEVITPEELAEKIVQVRAEAMRAGRKVAEAEVPLP